MSCELTKRGVTGITKLVQDVCQPYPYAEACKRRDSNVPYQ